MATMLSPEEQVMGAIGNTGATPEGGFDIVGALQEGYTQQDIADYLAQKKGFNIAGARQEGYKDDQIIAHLMGENAFTAGMKQFIQAGGSSIKGIAQRLGPEGGLLNTERALAERQAADIASANNPLAGGVGYVAGSFADPVALPFGLVKGLQGVSALGTLAKQGAAQGAFAGLLEPVLTPDDSIVKNIMFGTVAGAGLGAGIGKILDKVGAKAADVADVAKATEDANLAKQASTTAIEDVAQSVDINIPAYLRRTEGRGVEATMPTKGMDEATTKLIESKITQAEADIARAEERLYELGQAQPERQTAALFRNAPEVQTPAGMGLVERATGEAPQRQVASLFRPAQAVQPEVIREPVTQVPRLTDQQAYLNNIIETKRAEIDNLRAALQRGQQPQTFPVAGERPLQAPTAEAIAARDARMAEVLNAPLTVAEKQKISDLQKVLDDNGFKNMDEAIVATGKPDEVAAAQARIDSGNVQTLEQIVRGFRSGGSAAVAPERMYAGATVFPDVERAVVGAVMGEKAPRLKIEPVSNADVNKLLQDTVGFLGKDLKTMREGGDFSGTLKGTVEAGIASARKAAAEEGSYLNWLFKEDENGNFVNIDKSWSRGEIAAFMPVVRDATNVYNRLMDEAVQLNTKGNLDDAALQAVMEKMAYPIQIMGIFQAKRTQASRSLNAFRTLDMSLKEGKTVRGFMNAGVPCA